MSLINKVLRDLDRRKSAKTLVADTDSMEAVRAARVSSPVSPLKRIARWSVATVVTGAAVVAGGVAQGSISWPGREEVKPTVAAHLVQPAASPPAASAEPPAASAALQATAVLKRDAPVAAAASSGPALHAANASRPAASKSASPVSVATEARIAKSVPTGTPNERADVHYQRGILAYQSGRIEESAEAFTAALREDKAFVPARQAQAGVLIGQSRGDEAIALLREGLAATPQQPTLSLMLARMLADRGDIEGALSTLKTANGAGNADYLGLHAAILQRAERHAEAVELFTAALRLTPGHSVWWMGLGISLSAVNQNAQAREAFTRAKMIGALPPEAVQYVDGRLRQLM